METLGACLVLLFSVFSSGWSISREPVDVTVRGVLVCLTDQGETSPVNDDCSQPGERFALQSPTGKLTLFTPEDPRAEIFKDSRVWSREFEIFGRKRAENVIEIIHLHGIESEQLIRLYYRCDVCNIDAFAPGLCWCCQEEFEFRESPVEKSSAPTPKRK